MRKKQSEPVGLVAHQVLREIGLETPYNEYRLIQSWAEVMGEGIMRYTGEMYIRNRVLHVQIKSPALRAQLMASRQQLVYRLNQYVGAQVIERVAFTM